MVNTPAHPGPFDPLDRADPDQPFFPLMAGDPFAPPLVLDWADRTRRRGRATEDDKERARLFAKATEAEEIAWAMQRWEKTGSAADTRAASVRATYAGAEPVALDHRWKEQLTAGTAALRNAAFHFTEAAAGLDAGRAEALLEAVETINVIAAAYEPKRASFGAQSELPLTYADIGIA
jgi:hypothetical protein